MLENEVDEKVCTVGVPEFPAGIDGKVKCLLSAVKLTDGGFYFYSSGQTSPKKYFGPDLGDALSHFMHQFANEKNLVWSSDNMVKKERDEWQKLQDEEYNGPATEPYDDGLGIPISDEKKEYQDAVVEVHEEDPEELLDLCTDEEPYRTPYERGGDRDDPAEGAFDDQGT